MLLETRALERWTSPRLVQVCRCGRDDLIEGVDGLAGGLYAQTVCQVKGLDAIIEGGRAIVGGTNGVGQNVWVDGRYWAILVLDIGGEFGILGPFAMSAGPLATMLAVAALSLGRSVSAATAIGPALLLLGELGVCLLALHSAELIGLRGLAAAAMRGALLLEGEGRHLHNSIGLRGLDLTG